MKIDVLAGSKGGCSRSASSLLLAAGACELGFTPLHIQVVPSGRAPALGKVRRVPFEMASVAADGGEPPVAQILLHVRRRPDCFPVIVDTPCQRIRETMLMLVGIETRILLPMREEDPEIEWVTHDYREAKEERGRQRPRRKPLYQWEPPAWILPVGWPSSLRPSDFAAILHNRGLWLSTLRPYPVIHPGIPKFDRLDMTFIDEDYCFTLTDQQRDAASSVARALWGVPARS